MKVLIACEESQAVTIAFRKMGHEAYSCDIKKVFRGKARMAPTGRCKSLVRRKMGLYRCTSSM